jgi:hypothetical protein
MFGKVAKLFPRSIMPPKTFINKKLMKTRFNPSLRNYFSKHFANHVFPTLHQQVDCSKQQPLAFWQEQSVQVKM